MNCEIISFYSFDTVSFCHPDFSVCVYMHKPCSLLHKLQEQVKPPVYLSYLDLHVNSYITRAGRSGFGRTSFQPKFGLIRARGADKSIPLLF